MNGTNTKVGVIHSAVPPMLAFTNPNGQVDLRNIWTQTVKGADGHIYFYFAWERDANTGSGFIAYEFQQNALSPSCAYTAAGIDMILPQSAARNQPDQQLQPLAEPAARRLPHLVGPVGQRADHHQARVHPLRRTAGAGAGPGARHRDRGDQP